MRRAGRALLVLWGVATLVFFLFHTVGGDPARMMLGQVEEEQALAAVRAAYEAGTSLRSFVTADDVAAMALFLASPGGARISGQVLTLDGHTENPDPKI